MIVLKVEQAARMQRRKDEEREAKKCMLVSDIYIYIYIYIVLWVKRSLLLWVPHDYFEG
jgi:hypothetical protein